MKLMNGEGVHHYWDGDKHVGSAVQTFINGLGSPAWDFWMLYKPGTTWADSAPEPDWWEHQLGVLRREFPERELDAERFAEKARELARE